MDSAKLSELLNVSRLELHLKPEWGAENPGHRDLIRADLQSRIQGQESEFSFSISHTEGLGGYALLHKSAGANVQIGFDVEVETRVSEEVAHRVCATEEEARRAPSVSDLWSAKEAAFKSLRGVAQPEVLSGVEITSWARSSQFETFQFTLRQHPEKLKTLGLTWKKDVYQFAIACISS
jgi:4'-phosphopantetheinyl transferase EntD